MEEVEFLDSTGLGVLVGGLKKVRAHDGSLQLVCNQDRLLKIFRITGLAKVFAIHDSPRPALAAELTAPLGAVRVRALATSGARTRVWARATAVCMIRGAHA